MSAYAASLSGGWVYEDIRDQGIWATALRWPLGPRGLSSQSYAVTTAIVGPSAVAARAVSLAWHLLNGALLWLVARRVLATYPAVLAVGLFLLWPIQTEAVAAIAYRSEVIAATGLLLALLCASRGQVAGAWLCAAGSVLGKEAGVIALALVPLWAWWHGPRWTRRQAIGWGVASIYPAVALVEWFTTHQVPLWQSPASMAISAATVGRLVSLGLWSAIDPGVLSIDHDWRHLTPVMGVATAASAVLALWLWTGWARFAVIWIAVAMSLRVGLVLPEMHEHHVYQAWIAVSLAIAHLVFGGTLWADRTSSSNIRAHSTVPAV